MRKKLWIHIAMLMVIPGLLFTASCAKKQVVSADSSAAAAQAQQEAAGDAGDAGAKQQEMMMKEEAAAAEAEKAATMQAIQEEAAARETEMQQLAFENENIYFDFDKYDLTPQAQDVLVRKAEWMRANPMKAAIIEGHADERGTAEYNLALGERRAMAAMSFLVDLGIPSIRLSTISYGEERPVDPRSNEEAWARNRRAAFVVQ